MGLDETGGLSAGAARAVLPGVHRGQPGLPAEERAHLQRNRRDWDGVSNQAPAQREEEGKIVTFGKVRGRKQSIQALAEKYDTLVKNPGEQTVGIAHADCPEDADYLAGLLRKNFPPKDILTVCYEPGYRLPCGPRNAGPVF